jgi:hypothetical protein
MMVLLVQHRVSPHHAGGDLIQLVPEPLHRGVRHMGRAWQLRNPYWRTPNEAND